MNEQRAPRGSEWGEVLDVLHLLGNTVTVRAHYGEGHPAIAQADETAAAAFARVLERIPDLVVALVDGEFIVCERPLPDLRAKLHALADAMTRHDLECLVFQQGLTLAECRRLGSALARPAAAVPVREQLQADLTHVLLRFIVRAGDQAAGAGTSSSSIVPRVQELLLGIARAMANDGPVDKLEVVAVATQIVLACATRTAAIQQRSWTRSIEDESTHAANVATLTAMLALDAGYPQRVTIDATAAALLHDVGHLFLPEEIRGMPEPLLDERTKPIFRNHTFAGATMLLGAGCPALWVAAALEHHRGVDGGGYPALEASAPPHELVGYIALANFFDRKRTRLEGRADAPDDILRAALGLEGRYFGSRVLRRWLKVIGVFPPGTTVELTSLEPAIVTRAHASDPWRPQVRLLFGPSTGKLVDLREVHPLEARHRLSIVRAIAPPLLRLADTVVAEEEEAAAKVAVVEPVALAPPPRPPVAISARDAQDRARRELGGMGPMLDALLTVPPEALVSAMPPAPSRPPRAIPVTIPPYQAPIAGATASTMPAAPSGPPPQLEAPLIATLGSLSRVPVLASGAAQVNLDPRAAFVLHLIDGMSSVEDILDASGQPRTGILQLLAELLARGVITMR